MAIIQDESQEKKESLYPKYEKKNILTILSKLYKINFHYLTTQKKSVLCIGEQCYFCKTGHNRRSEYNYMVNLNGQQGVMDIKPTIFFSLNEIENATGKDKREVRWLILKSGEGLETKYTVSKDDNLEKAEYTEIEQQIEKNTETLTTAMEKREERMLQLYHEILNQDSQQNDEESSE